MSYFTPAFLQFFAELEQNNSKEWFDENRKTYESEVKKPFAAFVDEMIGRIQAHDPGVRIKASDAIMRINNDIRFSKDKTLYKTHVAANISRFGKKDKVYPGLYFQLSHAGVGVFGGAYMVDTATLQIIRSHIAQNPKAFADVYSNKDFTKNFIAIQGEKNKRIQPEFQPLLEKEPLIANKQFYYSASLKPDVITSPKLPEELMKLYLAGKPVNDFLKAAWGE
jgi:uncharacterized protein (TIGR02453 family)